MSNQILQSAYQYYNNLRQEMDRWLKQSMWMDPPGRNRGGEDEANYALAWFDHYAITESPMVLEHFYRLRTALIDWVERECYHGYEPEAEAHHGTEPFALFLPRYIGLKPNDQKAVDILLDASEHIGNWHSAVADWYDYDRDVFHSFYLGSKSVRREACDLYELGEHFRFILIALAAYRVSEQQRYLDWSIRYGLKRAERILAQDTIPRLWDLNGNPVGEAEIKRMNLHQLANTKHHQSGDSLSGIENLLASGAVYAFGDLYCSSGETIFKSAAYKIVKPLVKTLNDPYNEPAAAALSYYRSAFSDNSLDNSIILQLADLPRHTPAELALVFPETYAIREGGVGKRADMARWGEWSEDGIIKPIREPSPATLTLAFQVTGDPVYAERALKGASTRLMMARRVLRGGREHADMGGAICSIAAGHGRNWGTGSITGCYGPLLVGLKQVKGEMIPSVEFSSGAVPTGLMSLVRIMPNEDNTEVIFYNASSKASLYQWRKTGTQEWQAVDLSPQESRRIHIG